MFRRSISFSAVALAIALLLPACKKGGGTQIPDYPAMPGGGGNVFQHQGATVYHRKMVTSDFVQEIRAFYDKHLLSKPGWTSRGDKDFLVYSNGNMERSGQDGFLPADAAMPGGHIEVYGGETQSVIMSWESVPGAKK